MRNGQVWLCGPRPYVYAGIQCCRRGPGDKSCRKVGVWAVHVVHVDIGSSVVLTVKLPATAFGPAELFWLWGGDDAFAREHLHGSVLPGQTLRIATMAGEQWIAKDKASGTVLLTTTTTDAAEQSVELTAVAAPTVEKKAARFVKPTRKR